MAKAKRSKPRNGVKEIARRANVALATVDRVIHGRPGVSKKTLEKVKKVIEEMNYQPNIIGRRLASMKEYHFAVLIPEINEESGFFWEGPASGIKLASEEIKSMGVEVTTFFFDQNDKNSFVASADKILKGKFDGILLAPFFIEESIAFTNTCEAKAIPYVFINSDIPDQKSLSYIGPDLYASGYLGGQLINYLIKPGGQVLIVNISLEIKNTRQNRLLRKEEGVRSYFMRNKIKNEILKIDITNVSEKTIEKKILEVLIKNPRIGLIFVTNSRVVTVAKCLEKNYINHVQIIGYDLIPSSIDYLKNGIIDFLICQKPQEQGYRGIMTLYHHLILNLKVPEVYHMPIDIVTKENYAYYKI
ncbi:MAG: LacI family DNA-binding transcriptional regulator [Chitinophagaceae bacterium]|nr:LacI family DNA-binding transcriptional regulator [Chitinophagaceae bacterium]